MADIFPSALYYGDEEKIAALRQFYTFLILNNNVSGNKKKHNANVLIPPHLLTLEYDYKYVRPSRRY